MKRTQLQMVKQSTGVLLVAGLSVLLLASPAFAATTISDNISTGGTLAVTGASTLTGNVTAEGTLAVTGASTLTGAVTASAALSVGTTMTVTGASTLNGAVTLGDAVADILTVTGTIAGASPLVFEGATADAYELTIAVPDVGADATITLPSATGTLATLAGTETLTNKTLTSPTLTAPVLGTPASGVATNLTGTAAGLTAGSVTNATLTTALTVNTGTVTLVGNVAGSSITLPTTGTVATLAGTETLTNKTLTSPTLTTPALGVATATTLAIGGGTAIEKIVKGSLADDTSGWAPDGAATSFTITADAASVAATSYIAVNTTTFCQTSAKVAATSFTVTCSAAPADATTMQYIIVN